MQLSFFIPCIPPSTTSQQKGAFSLKTGGVRFYTKAKNKAAGNLYAALLMPHVPGKPLLGPLCVLVEFVLPWRKTEKKAVRKTFMLYPCATRPDCSNRIKQLEDVMTSLGFWEDDGQISSLSVRKMYGNSPGIGISIASATAIDNNGCVTSA
jgi:Holliday junction resolvase RusA-like endonuclease